MTLTGKTALSQTESLSFEFELHHAPEKVRRALTDQAQPMPGWDGIVNCRVLEIEAQRRLRYAWAVGGMDTENFGGARYGWKMMGGKLVDLLARTP